MPNLTDDARARLIEEALDAINASHARDCPWLRNGAASCTCGRLDLGVRVEAALSTAEAELVLAAELEAMLRKLVVTSTAFQNAVEDVRTEFDPDAFMEWDDAIDAASSLLAEEAERGLARG
jgi:hypothetical protein